MHPTIKVGIFFDRKSIKLVNLKTATNPITFLRAPSQFAAFLSANFPYGVDILKVNLSVGFELAVYILIHSYITNYSHIYIQIYTLTHAHTYINTRTHTHTYTHTHTHTPVCAHTYMYMHAHIEIILTK